MAVKTQLLWLQQSLVIAALASLAACGGGGSETVSRLNLVYSVPAGVTIGPMASEGRHLDHEDALPLVQPASVLGKADVAIQSSHWYRVDDAVEGSTLRLRYIDATGSEDLDLYVYDSSGTPREFSVAPPGVAESLSMPQSGQLFIEVRREGGSPSTRGQHYVLELLPISGVAPLHHRGLWNGGVAIVDGLGQQVSVAERPVGRSSVGADLPSRQVQVKTQQLEPASGAAFSNILVDNQAPAGRHLGTELERPAHLQRLGFLLAAKRQGFEPVVEVPGSAFDTSGAPLPVNDPDIDWQHSAANVTQGWLFSRGKPDAGTRVVAVIDAGVFPVRDLAGALLTGCTITESSPGALSCIDGQEQAVNDSLGHGLHVALTIAAVADNGLGSVGFSPDVKVLPIRATLGSQNTLRSDYGSAAIIAAVDRGASVINISFAYAELGFSGLIDALEYAVDNGVVVVFGAGNSGTRFNPTDLWATRRGGNTAGVYVVGAVARDGERASYSSTGPLLSVAAPVGDRPGERLCHEGTALTAPGQGIDGSQWVYSLVCLQGTSFAAPIFAAMVATMQSISPGITPQRIETMLRGGMLTRQSSAERSEEFGWGLVDFGKAAEASAIEGIATAFVEIIQSEIDLGGAGTQAMFDYRRTGFPGHSPVFSGLPGAFTVLSADTDAAGFGRYRVTLERAQLLDGAESNNTLAATTSLAKAASIPVYAYKAVRAEEGGQSTVPLAITVFRNGTEVGRGQATYQNGEFRLSANASALGITTPGQYVIKAAFTSSPGAVSTCGLSSVCNQTSINFNGVSAQFGEVLGIRF